MPAPRWVTPTQPRGEARRRRLRHVYSSLAYLISLPVTSSDRMCSLARDRRPRRRSRPGVHRRSRPHLGHVVVAEGVEDHRYVLSSSWPAQKGKERQRAATCPGVLHHAAVPARRAPYDVVRHPDFPPRADRRSRGDAPPRPVCPARCWSSPARPDRATPKSPRCSTSTTTPPPARRGLIQPAANVSPADQLRLILEQQMACTASRLVRAMRWAEAGQC